MNTLDIQRLAEHALGLSPQQTDALIDNGEDYDTPLKARFGVDLETFGKIADALISLTPLIEESQTKRLMHAFVAFDDGTIIASKEISPHDSLPSKSS